jgi:hypothetical protein
VVYLDGKTGVETNKSKTEKEKESQLLLWTGSRADLVKITSGCLTSLIILKS